MDKHYVREKIFEDDSVLKLATWERNPGENAYQMELHYRILPDSRSNAIIYSTVSDGHFTEEEIRDLFDRIDSKRDFERLEGQVNERV